MIADIFILFMMLVRWVIGVSLVLVALRQNVRNLLWLALVFFINGVFNIFTTTTLAPNSFLSHIGMLLAQVAQVMFVHQTFYRDRQSPAGVFMGITLVVSAAVVLCDLSGAMSIGHILVSVPLFINWVWHTGIAYRAYRAIAPDRFVEDWVKVRYQLMLVYCVVGFLVAVPVSVGLLRPEIVSIRLLVVVGIVTGLVCQFLVWVLPEGFRRWTNRNYHLPAQAEAELALSEEEILRQLKG
jgi:hypothetical protein